MTRTAGRPKPPPYPRAVPEVYVEEVQGELYDVVDGYSMYGVGFEQRPDEDADAYAGRRAAKKRRIEASAEAYLRGQTVHIMSAQLKGPFDKAWKNPWSRRQACDKVDSVEVVTKNVRMKDVARNTVEFRKHTKHKRQRFREANDQMFSTNVIQDDQPDTQSRHDLSGPALEAQRRSLRRGRKVEDWLRKSDTFIDNADKSPFESSPTPHGGRDSDLQNSESFEDVYPQGQSQRYAGLTAYERIQQLSRNMSDALNTHQNHDGTPQPTAGGPANAIAEQPARAESAILHARRTAIHINNRTEIQFKDSVTAAPEPDGEAAINRAAPHDVFNDEQDVHTCPDNAREEPVPFDQLVRVQGRATEVTIIDANQQSPQHVHSMHNSTSAKVIVGPSASGSEEIDDESHETIVPAHKVAIVEQPHAMGSAQIGPSGATSRCDTTDLPSAQQPVFYQESLLSTDMDIQLADPESALPANQNLLPRAKSTGADVAKTSLNSGNALDFLSVTSRDNIAVGHTGQQDMQEANNPDHVPNIITTPSCTVDTKIAINLGDIKHTWNDSLSSEAKHPEKKKKRASFAPNTHDPRNRQYSIKQMAKVKVGKNTSTPTLHSKIREDEKSSSPLQDENSEQVGITSGASSIGNSIGRSGKGILKSTNPTNSQNSNKNVKNLNSSSQQQDGQRDTFMDEIQHAVLDEEEFDLDAAIEDLGSFLGSWNAEKEASGVMR